MPTKKEIELTKGATGSKAPKGQRAKAKEYTHFVVEHTLVSLPDRDPVNQGDVLTADELGGHRNRLLQVGAVRGATAEEVEEYEASQADEEAAEGEE